MLVFCYPNCRKHEFSCHSFPYPFIVLFLLRFYIISGSLLLDSLLSYLTTPERQNCKAVYLHVLTTNSAAMQFYERKHFSQFRYLPLYYAINGTHKDGFSYVLYINGGEPPWTLAYPFKTPAVHVFFGLGSRKGGWIFLVLLENGRKALARHFSSNLYLFLVYCRYSLG